MFLQAILNFLINGIHLILHVQNNGEFPRPLSKSDEEKYIKLWIEEKDENAKEMLIEHNLRLVAHIIKKYNIPQSEQDDIISIGTIGLIKAINNYKPNKLVRLSTFAARCIENEVLMQFRSKKKTAQNVYMSDPIDIDTEGNTLTLSDIISDDEDIIDNIDKRIKIKKLYKYIESELDTREKQIIIMRYGINGTRELTQREVAKKLNISRSYVSRIEKHALKKLQDKFNNK